MLFDVGRASGTELSRLLWNTRRGNFHLKVGGPKAVAMLVTLCWGLQ